MAEGLGGEGGGEIAARCQINKFILKMKEKKPHRDARDEPCILNISRILSHSVIGSFLLHDSLVLLWCDDTLNSQIAILPRLRPDFVFYKAHVHTFSHGPGAVFQCQDAAAGPGSGPQGYS